MAIGDKLPELDPITAVEIASDDLYYIVDISEDTSKKMTAEELATYIINENETWRISNYSGSTLGGVARSNTEAFIFHSGAVGAKGFFTQGGEAQAVNAREVLGIAREAQSESATGRSRQYLVEQVDADGAHA